MGKRRRYNWGVIAEEYITGGDDITHAALARKYNAPLNTISRRAMVDEWTQQRVEHRNKSAILSQQKALEKIAQGRAEQIARNYEALRTAQDRLLGAIQNEALTANSLDAAARVLCDVIRAIELISGEPDSHQKSEHAGGVRHVFKFVDMEPMHDGSGTGDGNGDADTELTSAT